MVTKLGKTISRATSFFQHAYEIEELIPDGRILRVNGKYLKRDRLVLTKIVIKKLKLIA